MGNGFAQVKEENFRTLASGKFVPFTVALPIRIKDIVSRYKGYF